MKVAAIGRHELLYQSVLRVAKGGHKIVAVITCKEASDYRTTTKDFRVLAIKLGAAFVETERINSPEIVQLLKDQNPEIGISFNWRTLIPQNVLGLFPLGIINAHPGDLPKYRGNAAPNWAILSGERETALTLYLMTAELDAGPILLKRRMHLSDNTYVSQIYEFILRNGPDMFLEAINGLADGSVKPRRQLGKFVLRGFPRIPKDGEIDWRQPASKLHRLVRAVSDPFDGAYTFLGTEKVIVWKAHVETPSYRYLGTPGQVAERRPNSEVAVVTGKDLLVLEEIETRNQGRRKPSEIIKSAKARLGMDVTGEIARMREKLDELLSKQPLANS